MAVSANSVLVPFDTIMDTDIGLFRLIKTDFSNDEYLYTTFLSTSTMGLRQLLYTREKQNPLIILLKSRFEGTEERLYNEFMNNNYEEIVRRSSPNAIKELVESFFLSKLVKVTILCKNDYEKEHIKKIYHDRELSILVESDYAKVDITNYDTIFIKVYEDILKFKNLLGKNIYLLDYKFNIDFDHNKNIRPRINIESQICNANQTILVSPYTIERPVIVG